MNHAGLSPETPEKQRTVSSFPQRTVRTSRRTEFTKRTRAKVKVKGKIVNWWCK